MKRNNGNEPVNRKRRRRDEAIKRRQAKRESVNGRREERRQKQKEDIDRMFEIGEERSG